MFPNHLTVFVIFYYHSSYHADQDLNKAKSASKQKRRAAKRFLEDADLNEEEDLPVEIYVC